MRHPVRTALVAGTASLCWLGLVGPDATARPSGPAVPALVVLREHADLAAYRHQSHHARRTGVVQALRDTAATSQRGILAALQRQRAAGEVSDIDPLWIVNGIEVTATPAALARLARRPDVQAVVPVTTVEAPSAPDAAALAAVTVEPEIAKVGAPVMWALGQRGQGVVVASMDTGVDVSHPDLASRWRGGTNSWYDPNGQHPTTPVDVSGHGTWTTGVMVGGTAGGSSVGMAPDAQWIGVKIFNDRGSATTTGIHRGFQWLLDPDGNPATDDAPDVVNDSWTTQGASCVLEFQPDLQSLRAAGIVPVFAAGNAGPGPGTARSPANLPEALAVGSTDLTDLIDPSSSRGPSSCGQSVYPQLVAPGVGTRTTDLYGGYTVQSGTSLAAPVVSGALALLLGAMPDLSADRQVAALQSTALDLGTAGADTTYGNGRLDVPAAYQWLLGAPDFQVAVSPADTSVQPGGSAVFTVDVAASGGFAGAVALSTSALPAGVTASFVPASLAGNGSSQLTMVTAPTVAPGSYPVTVVATSGALVRSAPATLNVAPPPDYAVSVTPATSTVTAGTTGTATISVTALNGFSSAVALSVSGLPSAVGTAGVTPTSLTAAGTAQLSVVVAASAPAGSYPLTVTATSGPLSHSTSFTVVVPTRDFTLSVSPSTVTVLKRQAATTTVSVTAVGGASDVTFSATGLPPGATATWTPTHVVGTGQATLRITTSSSTPRRTSTIRVVGTSGALVHETTYTLTVR